MRLASPKPGFCSVTFAANPDIKYVDCEADYDGAPVLDAGFRQTLLDVIDLLSGDEPDVAKALERANVGLKMDGGTIAVLPWNGQLGGHDNLYISEPAIREMAELIAYKPELHRRQLNEIRKLELQVEHWKAATRRFKDMLDRQVEADLGDRPRRVKAVA